MKIRVGLTLFSMPAEPYAIVCGTFELPTEPYSRDLDLVDSASTTLNRRSYSMTPDVIALVVAGTGLDIRK